MLPLVTMAPLVVLEAPLEVELEAPVDVGTTVVEVREVVMLVGAEEMVVEAAELEVEAAELDVELPPIAPAVEAASI